MTQEMVVGEMRAEGGGFGIGERVGTAPDSAHLSDYLRLVSDVMLAMSVLVSVSSKKRHTFLATSTFANFASHLYHGHIMSFCKAGYSSLLGATYHISPNPNS